MSLKNKLKSVCTKIKNKLRKQLNNNSKMQLLNANMDKKDLIQRILAFNPYLLELSAHEAYNDIGSRIYKFFNLDGELVGDFIHFSCSNVGYSANININNISWKYIYNAINVINKSITEEYDEFSSSAMEETYEIDTHDVFNFKYTDEKLNESVKEAKKIIGLQRGREALKKLSSVVTEILSIIESMDIVYAFAYIPLYPNVTGSVWSPYSSPLWHPYPIPDINYKISEKKKFGLQKFSELINQLYVEKYPSKRRIVFSNSLTNETKEIYQKAYDMALNQGLLTDEFEPDFSTGRFNLFYKIKLK